MNPRPASTTTTDQDLEEEATTTGLPGFLPPSPPPGPDPIPPEGATTTDLGTPPQEEPTTSPLGDEADAGGPTAPTDPGPSPASTADPELLAGLCAQAVGVASIIVRFVRARMVRRLPEGVWIADEEDMAAIGAPLSRIAARRVPETSTAAVGDVADGIELAVGVVGYTLKNVQREAYMVPVPDADPDE